MEQDYISQIREYLNNANAIAIAAECDITDKEAQEYIDKYNIYLTNENYGEAENVVYDLADLKDMQSIRKKM